MDLTVGALLDIYREEVAGDDIRGSRSGGVPYVPYQLPQETFIVNGQGEFDIDETLTFKGEAKLGLGSYEEDNDPEDIEASRFDFGLYGKLIKELENDVEVHGAYRLERTSSTTEIGDLEEEYTMLQQRFEVGGSRPIEGNLRLTGDVHLSPSSVEFDNGNELDYSILDMGVTTGVKYEF